MGCNFNCVFGSCNDCENDKNECCHYEDCELCEDKEFCEEHDEY